MKRGKKNESSGEEYSFENDKSDDSEQETTLKKPQKNPSKFAQAYKNRLLNPSPKKDPKLSAKPLIPISKARKSITEIEEGLEVKEKNAKESEEIYLKIKKWREANQAVVDTQGAQQHFEKDDQPNEQAFQVMIGVLLSVQSTDQATNKVMKSLLKDGISIEKYSKLTPKEIQEKIQAINFNQNKSNFIHSAALKIVKEFEGVVPSTLKELTSFKGIGPKVAHLILQVSFGKTSGIPVDTHVHRISNRLGFVKFTKDPVKTMDGLMKKFDEKYWEEINQNLVGFGQLVCGKVKPKCDLCPVRS